MVGTSSRIISPSGVPSGKTFVASAYHDARSSSKPSVQNASQPNPALSLSGVSFGYWTLQTGLDLSI